MRHDDLVEVDELSDRLEAGVVLSALEAAGIQATIRADDEGGQGPFLAFTTGGYKIMVRSEDAETARDILTNRAKPVE